mmetsp:Transcript_9701/g.26291  ORF Transcript_9701/g.26291 Transcript_9701/m.26291 type:complete len:221 (-) Transcript_9701:990-1652(-)
MAMMAWSGMLSSTTTSSAFAFLGTALMLYLADISAASTRLLSISASKFLACCSLDSHACCSSSARSSAKCPSSGGVTMLPSALRAPSRAFSAVDTMEPYTHSNTRPQWCGSSACFALRGWPSSPSSLSCRCCSHLALTVRALPSLAKAQRSTSPMFSSSSSNSSDSLGSAFSRVLSASTFSVSHSKIEATSSGTSLSRSSNDSSLTLVVSRCSSGNTSMM